MNRFFRRLPLSFKLILVAIILLAFVFYLTFQVYVEKNKSITLIKSSVESFKQAGNISSLIQNLQQEQKLSFDVVKNKKGLAQLIAQRLLTDSGTQLLRASADPITRGYEIYTGLGKLVDTRNKIDSGICTIDQLIHFYSNAIFRLNTLVTIPYNSGNALEPYFSDMESQKILTEITTYLSIIRANIYNVLTTRKYMIETLMGTAGAYDVYKSYDTEFKIKANATTLKSYQKIIAGKGVYATTIYIDKLFSKYEFDSVYTAEEWWTVSEKGLQELLSFREGIRRQLSSNVAVVQQSEIKQRDLTLVLMLVISVLVLGFIGYTVVVITSMLLELKRAAEKIAFGKTGIVLNIPSKDAFGSLADSVLKIAENSHSLSFAAEQIGKGNFEVPVHVRSKEDILANAIISMKENLQSSIHALEDSEKQFKQLADAIPQIIWTTDSNGNIDYFNKQWFAYAGNQPMREVIHAADAGELEKRWLLAQNNGNDFEIEVRLQHHVTKEFRWFLSRSIPIRDSNNKITKWFGTTTDIHERKSISEALEKLVQKRTSELKRSNEELMQFAHVASHDMKEPLRKIKVFMSMLETELMPASDKSKLFVSKISGATDRLILLVEGVLKYASISNDERSFEKINLNTMLADIVTDLEIPIQQKNAIIQAADLPMLNGIPVLINQLFFNLLSNALKFSQETISPEITITAEIIVPKSLPVITALSEEEYCLQISVADNGIGFSEDYSNKIFNVFVRLNARDKYEGTGLGLALCKKIMERHDGAIYVNSEQGKGADFSLLFPLSCMVDNSVG